MDNKQQQFVMKYNLPNGGQMHFRPDKITHADLVVVTLQGVESSSNTQVDVNLPTRVFKKIVADHPESQFLINEWNKNNEKEIQVNHE